MGLDAASAARVLPKERDPVSVPDGAIERVRKPQDRVVDENLDMLRQVPSRAVPEDIPQRRVPIAESREDGPHRGPGSSGFFEDPSPRAVPSHELRHPGDRLHGDVDDFGLRNTEGGMLLNHG